MSRNGVVENIFRGMEALQVKTRSLLLPGSLGAAATLLRVAALTCFLPLVHGLFSPGNASLGKLKLLADYLPLETYPLHVVLSVLIILLATAAACCAFASDAIEASLFRSAESRLQEQVFRQYLSFGQPYYDRIHLSTSATQLRRLPLRTTRLISFLSKNIKSSLGLLIYLVGMVVLSWQLSLVVFASLALYLLAFGRLSSRVEEIEARIDSTLDNANEQAQDILANAALVRHSRAQDYEAERWRGFTEQVTQATQAKQQLSGIIDPAINFFGVVILLAVVLGSSTLLGEVQTYEAVRYLLFFLFFRRVVNAFTQFLRIPGEWKNIQRDLNKYFAVMDDSDKGRVLGGKQDFTGLTDDIEVSEMNFSYSEDKLALRHVNLTIPHNRITIIVGASGSGKSSFIKLLLREYEYQTGDICINGESIRQYSTDSLLQHSAFLGRESQLFSSSIEYNLRYGTEPVHDAEIQQALEGAQCRDMVEDLPLGLQTDMGDHGNLFSSGEQQRIALARLLLQKESRLFLLDEATSAVDGRTEIAIVDHLLSIENATIVLVAHRLSVIGSDMHVVLFDSGTVLEQGRCDQLLAANGPFRKLWDSQNLGEPRGPQNSQAQGGLG